MKSLFIATLCLLYGIGYMVLACVYTVGTLPGPLAGDKVLISIFLWWMSISFFFFFLLIVRDQKN